ncbi:MAG: PIN domain-containing protein [Bacteroidales bacterium]|nr:PIN domain-containing protein [Bacteroidales bacterium]
MKKVFVDTNVLLDLLLERDPWAKDAAILFSMADRREIELLCCSLSFSTAIYLMQRFKYTRKEIVSKLSIVKSICTITTINGSVIDRILQSDFCDLEDAIQYYSALAYGAEVIVTRNTADFSEVRIPVFTPQDYLQNNK